MKELENLKGLQSFEIQIIEDKKTADIEAANEERDRLLASVKDFEEQFLSELEAKHPEILAEFKKGNLPEDGIKTMVEFAKTIAAQYK